MIKNKDIHSSDSIFFFSIGIFFIILALIKYNWKGYDRNSYDSVTFLRYLLLGLLSVFGGVLVLIYSYDKFD